MGMGMTMTISWKWEREYKYENGDRAVGIEMNSYCSFSTYHMRFCSVVNWESTAILTSHWLDLHPSMSFSLL